MYSQLNQAVEYIQDQMKVQPDVGLILGSGLGFIADQFEEMVSIPYQDIPHFPTSTIVGHEGSLVIGTLNGQHCICMKGRVHFYEGYSMKMLTFPIYVMQKLGVKSLLVTNAAGGVNPQFSVGDLMVITDHINFMGTNPLIGPNLDQLGPRFPDMSFAYTPELLKIWREEAEKRGLTLREGVYTAMSGPSYETPAEIRMLHRIGSDAVGMSTIPEVIAASHCGLRVTGLSVITNAAAGLSDQALSHEEVKETSERVRAHLAPLVCAVIARL